LIDGLDAETDNLRMKLISWHTCAWGREWEKSRTKMRLQYAIIQSLRHGPSTSWCPLPVWYFFVQLHRGVRSCRVRQAAGSAASLGSRRPRATMQRSNASHC